jgi:ADP-ribose pyrophosphatase YjhB (NUDIX family)
MPPSYESKAFRRRLARLVVAKSASTLLEGTGLIIRPMRLLALFDKEMHPHPPQPWHVYKAFVQCEVESGLLLQETTETKGASWFTTDELTSLNLSADPGHTVSVGDDL